MKGRLLGLFVWLARASIMFIGGVLAMALVPIGFGASVSELVYASHGTVGFVFGIAFVLGAAFASVIYWLVTGKNLMAQVFFGDDHML